MWTYIKYDSEGEYLPEERDKLPGERTAYLAFDSLRWAVVIGYTENGGFSSILHPNVTDDCNIIAWAPLSETTDPDMEEILRSCPWTEADKYNCSPITLLRFHDQPKKT